MIFSTSFSPISSSRSLTSASLVGLKILVGSFKRISSPTSSNSMMGTSTWTHFRSPDSKGCTFLENTNDVEVSGEFDVKGKSIVGLVSIGLISLIDGKLGANRFGESSSAFNVCETSLSALALNSSLDESSDPENKFTSWSFLTVMVEKTLG